MNPNEIAALLEQIGEILTPSAERAFALTLANVGAEAAVYLWLTVACGVVAALCVGWFCLAIRAGDGSEGFPAWIGGCFAIAGAVLGSSAYLLHATPEYYAMMRLIEVLVK